MKKLIRRKLPINGEIIRSLATPDLTQVVGGEETVTTATGRTVCVAAAVVIDPKLGG
jgi:hypothetical protein